MPRYSSMPVRIWRQLPCSRSPLMRPSDRAEALIRIAAAAVMLAAIPVAGAAGTAEYSSAQVSIAAENASKTDVAATISDDPVTVVRSDAAGQAIPRTDATVTWTYGGHTGHTVIAVAGHAHRGDTVPVWVDRDGRQTDPPLDADAAASRGIGAGVLLLVAIWSSAVALVVFTHRQILRLHTAEWAREWRLLTDHPLGQGR